MGLYDGHNDDSIYEDCYSDRSLLDTPSAPAPTPNLCPASRSVQLKPALLQAPDTRILPEIFRLVQRRVQCQLGSRSCRGPLTRLNLSIGFPIWPELLQLAKPSGLRPASEPRRTQSQKMRPMLCAASTFPLFCSGSLATKDEDFSTRVFLKYPSLSFGQTPPHHPPLKRRCCQPIKQKNMVLTLPMPP